MRDTAPALSSSSGNFGDGKCQPILANAIEQSKGNYSNEGATS